MSLSKRALAIGGGAVAVIALASLVNIGVSLHRIRGYVQTIDVGHTATTWHFEEPPAGVEIVGLWMHGDSVVSNVAMRVLDMYYLTEPGLQTPVEVVHPLKWTYLP